MLNVPSRPTLPESRKQKIGSAVRPAGSGRRGWLGVGGRHAEARVVARHVVGEHGVGLLERRCPSEPQLAAQAVLGCAPQLLDGTLACGDAPCE